MRQPTLAWGVLTRAWDAVASIEAGDAMRSVAYEAGTVRKAPDFDTFLTAALSDNPDATLDEVREMYAGLQILVEEPDELKAECEQEEGNHEWTKWIQERKRELAKAPPRGERARKAREKRVEEARLRQEFTARGFFPHEVELRVFLHTCSNKVFIKWMRRYLKGLKKARALKQRAKLARLKRRQLKVVQREHLRTLKELGL
jgi:hypothetical protein